MKRFHRMLPLMIGMFITLGMIRSGVGSRQTQHPGDLGG